MTKLTTLFLFLATIGLLRCTPDSSYKQKEQTNMNILLQEWTGPYGGVPAFDKMDVSLLQEAMERGMEIELEEIEAIANNTEMPTFENTILALESCGEVFQRVRTYYDIYSGNLSSDAFREVEKVIEPKKSAHYSQIIQNEKLFQRIKSVYDDSQKKPLPDDQQRLVKLTYQSFASNGAELNEADKKRYATIDKELSEIYAHFSNNVLHDEEAYITYINKDQLSGLPQSFVESAAIIASENGKEGMYAITNTRSSMDPFLTYSNERTLRKQVWENYYSRGDNGDEYDNNELIVKILKLRDERSKLLGFNNFAEWHLQRTMAKNPENAMALLDKVWPSAIARVTEEVADMQAIANQEEEGITIEPWDYRYYAEKVRKAKYDLNSNEVKEYLQLDKLREAMFFVAEQLFDFKFIRVKEGEVPVFHEDVKVWKVTNANTGDHIGLWYLDPFARKGKRSGAWANTYRSHANFNGKRTVLCSNNSNFMKGKPGEPVLVSWDDATTFFHEMGHALHFLSSNVKYPGLNGALRDYVEFQSQLLEHWLSTDEVINNYLVHYETGKSIPQELIAKIKKASTFNTGFSTTEYMASAIMDLKYHTIEDLNNLDVDSFERETLKSMNMPKEVVMRHRTPHFGHIFSGEGYAAGYYGYMWADVITADAAEAFAESPGGYFDKVLAQKMVKHLFAPQNSIDPAIAYRNFRGRDASIDALMRDHGFPVTKVGETMQ